MMKSLAAGGSDARKTKVQLLDELIELRQRVTQLDAINRQSMTSDQTSSAVRQAETDFLKKVQAAAHVGHWTWDVQSNRVSWSDEMYRIFGLNPIGFSGDLAEVIRTAIHPDDRAKVDQANTAVSESGRPAPLDYRVVWLDGTVRTVHAEPAEQTRDEHGNVIRLWGIVQDITERKQAEEALRESEERFRLLFQNLTSGFALHEIIRDGQGQPCDYRFLEINPAFEALTGLKAPDLIGKTVLQVMPDTEADWIDHYGQVALTGTPIHFENFSGALGKYYEISAYSPRPGQFAVIFLDITERKQAEHEIEILARFPAENPNPVLRLQPDGVILYANEASHAILQEWGCAVGEVAPPVWRTAVAATFAARSNKQIDVEFVSGVWSFFMAPSVEAGYINLYGRDITERRRMIDEIRTLNVELEQRVIDRTAQLAAANKELEAFAYSVSHDLRAPLRAIDGFSRILLEDYADQFDAEGQRLFGIVRANAQKMDQLITDLLALSRVSRTELLSARIDMTSLVQAVYEDIVLPEVQAQFTFTVAPLPAADGDATLLRQVWSNLLANAIKYTLPQSVRRIEVGGYRQGDEHIYFVTDTGVGFNPDYAHKLFGVFQRLHKATEFEGTGVGLAIVQRIVQRHGGRVWGEGQVDRGAAFYFSLPYSEVDHEPSA